MPLEKLPSIIANSKFTADGFVESDQGLLVPAYVGSQMGFSSLLNRLILQEYLYPELLKRNVLALCPFQSCGEYLDFSQLNEDMPFKQHREFWEKFNGIIGPVNYETLMPRSKFMIALFDGSHAVDDGLASEVAYFSRLHGRVIGIRSDFRLAENLAAPINIAVRYFLDAGPYNGMFFSGPKAYDLALNDIAILAHNLISEKK